MEPTQHSVRKQRKFSAAFKAKVALEAIRAEEEINQIASRNAVHPSQVKTWKRDALGALPLLFEKHRGDELKQKDELIDALYKKIGQREIELEWLKKKVGPLA